MKSIFFVGLILGLVGCSGGTTSVVPMVPADPLSAPTKKEVLENPYALRILDEVNDGHTLHVVAEVKASISPLSLPAVLRLTTMKAGEQVKVVYFPISQGVNSGQEGQDVKLRYDLATQSEEVTDYQLELVWGQEAKEHLASDLPPPPVLELRNVHIEQSGCHGTIACAGKLRIIAELFNPGFSPVTAATIGVGFLWQADGQEMPEVGSIPEKEQKLALQTLNLAPGQTRALNLTLNREIPQQPGGKYRPVLRLVAPEANKPVS